MNCPKCLSEKYVKYGVVGGLQRYKCKICEYAYTVAHRGKPHEMKQDALRLYLEGLGFRAIGRFLKVSHVAVFNWIKEFGKQAASEAQPEHSGIVELDELHSYVGEKKTTSGFGRRLTGAKRSLSTS